MQRAGTKPILAAVIVVLSEWGLAASGLHPTA
jgi:hypothetical protein